MFSHLFIFLNVWQTKLFYQRNGENSRKNIYPLCHPRNCAKMRVYCADFNHPPKVTRERGQGCSQDMIGRKKKQKKAPNEKTGKMRWVFSGLWHFEDLTHGQDPQKKSQGEKRFPEKKKPRRPVIVVLCKVQICPTALQHFESGSFEERWRKK